MRARRPAPVLLHVLTWLSAALLVAGVIGLAGLWLLNRHGMPPLVAMASQALSARCSCAVSVAEARLRPFRGIVLSNVLLTTDDDRLRVAAASVTIRLEIGALLRLRHGLPAVPPVRDPAGAFAAIAAAADAGAVPRSVVIDDAVLTVHGEGRQPFVIDWHRTTLQHDRRTGNVLFTATGSGRPGTPGSSFAVAVDANYRRSHASGEVDLLGLPVAVSAVRDGDIRTTLSVLTRSAGGLAVSGAITAAGLSVDLPILASEEIGPLDLRYDFDLTTGGGGGDRDGSLVFAFGRGDLIVNGVSFSVIPTFDASEGAVGVVVSLPETPVDDLLDAVPTALLGPLRTLRADGTFAWDLELRVPLDAVSGMSWVSHPRLEDFAVRTIDASVNPFTLNGSFVHMITDRHLDYQRAVRIPAARLPGIEWSLAHSEHTAKQVSDWRQAQRETRWRVAARPPSVVGGAVPVSPDPTYRYVRLEAMSPWIVRAVLTAEDGDFFFHPGVNVGTLGWALERNLEAGEILLGASTISMQLVKMLFLDDQRIMSRKLQEVFLVYLMEHEVPVSKERILEIYLNVAEFGPGVFGIADAASYYFRKHPRELTVGEATWLASILPSPKRHHAYYDAGQISDGWFIRMKSLYDIMLERGRMTETEHREAVVERPRFWFEAESHAGASAFGYSDES